MIQIHKHASSPTYTLTCTPTPYTQQDHWQKTSTMHSTPKYSNWQTTAAQQEHSHYYNWLRRCLMHCMQNQELPPPPAAVIMVCMLSEGVFVCCVLLCVVVCCWFVCITCVLCSTCEQTPTNTHTTPLPPKHRSPPKTQKSNTRPPHCSTPHQPLPRCPTGPPRLLFPPLHNLPAPPTPHYPTTALYGVRPGRLCCHCCM